MLNPEKKHWVLKLAPDQVHASPTWADGKLYVPMFNGKLFVVADRGGEGKIISELDLGSACLAAPSVAHGRVFVQTKRKLFCFGSACTSPGICGPSLSHAEAGEGGCIRSLTGCSRRICIAGRDKAKILLCIYIWTVSRKPYRAD